MTQKSASYSPLSRSVAVSFLSEKHNNSFQTLAENMPDIICRYDQKSSHLYVNPAITKVTGIKQDMFIGRTPHDVMPKAFADLWVTHIQRVFQTKKPLTMEFVFPSENGERHFQSYLVPEFDATGEMATVLSISRDITLIKEEEKRKDEFFGIVSHELKTPVTSIKAFAQLLQKKLKKAGDGENATHLAKMDAQIDKLTNLISDLLDVTRLVGGKLQFQEQRFDFNALVKEVVSDIRPITDLRILVRGKSTKQLVGDKERIGQVITNFLTNAIKYSHTAKKIVIAVTSDKEYVTCCVKDFGVGIAPDQREKLFERFYQLRRENSGRQSGLGLGLYIASEIINQHNGKIWVESVVGKGSTFCFSIPYKKLSKSASSEASEIKLQ